MQIPVEFHLGEPFLPFQQLLAVLPAASSKLLPEPFQVRAARALCTGPARCTRFAGQRRSAEQDSPARRALPRLVS